MTVSDVPEIIVLVGLMGTGKSTVARLLSDELGRECVDTDRLVEEESGLTVREIFQAHGEPRFRELESHALEKAVRGGVPRVVAAAGGVVVTESNRTVLNDLRRSGRGVVVWLSASIDELLRRTEKGTHRPLLDRGADDGIRSMSESREALYQSVADSRIDTTGLMPKEVCASIRSYLSRRAGTDSARNE